MRIDYSITSLLCLSLTKKDHSNYTHVSIIAVMILLKHLMRFKLHIGLYGKKHNYFIVHELHDIGTSFTVFVG